MGFVSWRSAPFHLTLLVLACRLTRGQENADCPGDGRMWVPFQSSCYHFVHGDEDVKKSYSIEDAKQMCSGYGLLTVKSVQENDFVVKYSPNVWKTVVNIWLDVSYDIDDDVFRWRDDNSALDYSNWEAGDSDDTDLSLIDTCITLHSGSGQWENVSCSDEPAGGVVCETKSFPIRPQKGSPLLSALVVVSVVLVMLVSALIWFLHQRKVPGSSGLTLMEYHPSFSPLAADRTCLVEAEESEET